jgi:hypothetical protein
MGEEGNFFSLFTIEKGMLRMIKSIIIVLLVMGMSSNYYHLNEQEKMYNTLKACMPQAGWSIKITHKEYGLECNQQWKGFVR